MRPKVGISLMWGRLITCGGLSIRLVLYRKKIGPIYNRPQATNLPHKRRLGSAALETVMVLPFLLVLLLGTVEIAKITYTYYTLHKMLYSLARYLGTQQGTNFCDPSDPNILAAKNFALTGTSSASELAIIYNLTPDMIYIPAQQL